MQSQREQERLDRLREKHVEGLLLWELENGFELSPRESHLVLETAKGILLDHRQVERGRVWIVGVEIGQSAGKRMYETKKKEVQVTIDGGLEDGGYEKKHGRIELRGMRLLRVIEEGIEQGVVFSEEDLGKLLGKSVRTVKRDVARLRKQGCEVQTRGYYEGIGRAISHKPIIVEYYLRGMTYAQIEERSRHTGESIKRYVETFGRVVYAMKRRDLLAGERSYILGISPSLLKEYEKLSCQARKKYPEKLKEIERRFGGYSNPLPYKEIDKRKEGFRGSVGKKNRRPAHASA
jgi:biotin operon repressor